MTSPHSLFLILGYPVTQFASTRLLPCDSGLLRNKSQVFYHGGDERDSGRATFGFREPFGITWNQRASRPRCGTSCSEGANPIVDLAFEFGRVDEGVDSHRSEEVTDPLPHSPRRLGMIERERRSERSPIRAAERPAQQIDHRAETIPFVTTVIAIGSERQHRTAIDHRMWIRGRIPVAVDRPAVGDRLVGANRHLNFAKRSRRSCHVDHDRRLFETGKCDR